MTILNNLVGNFKHLVILLKAGWIKREYLEMQQYFVVSHLVQWYFHRFGLIWMSYFHGEEHALSKPDYQARF